MPIAAHAGSFDCVRLSPHSAQDDPETITSGIKKRAETNKDQTPDPRVLLHRFRQILPPDQHKALVFQKFLELSALDHVEVALTPGCAPVGMVGGCTAHLI